MLLFEPVIEFLCNLFNIKGGACPAGYLRKGKAFFIFNCEGYIPKLLKERVSGLILMVRMFTACGRFS
ncbi:hypothetical protein BMS3Bbin09_01788 [bacterium BMS3Bbin09]|nr:hypothetical protein BMS3Bbin09_01788 [bacterium BMS3Bbin09]